MQRYATYVFSELYKQTHSMKDIHTLGSIWPGGLSCMKEPFADFFWTWIFKRLKQMCVYVQAAAYCFTGCPIEAYVLIVFAVVDRIVLA